MNPRSSTLMSLIAASLLLPGTVDRPRAERMTGDDQTIADLVRQATARFRNVDEAIAAGYAPAFGCVSGPQEGAMGVHYVNGALFDDRIDVNTPEALVYEPRNGQLHLVAVEYIADYAAWHSSHAPDVTPDVLGHLFHYNSGPNRYGPGPFYELHVWAWKLNPNGTFADWNPRVSCADYPTQTSASAHGH